MSGRFDEFNKSKDVEVLTAKHFSLACYYPKDFMLQFPKKIGF